MSKPVVAIVGRPNVGKSTLFNRLAGARKAIVEDIAGVTRDRLYDKSDWAGKEFIIIDTGGIRFDDGDTFASEIKLQAQIAIEEADVIIFVVDAKDGITHEDQEVGKLLRKSKKPIVLAANKIENFSKHIDYYEFYNLGLGEPIPVSAMHGMNTNDLLDAVIDHFKPEFYEEEDTDRIKIAIVGRPNVGKSSLVNSLLGEERVIVSDIPGTTRDSIDTPFEFEGKKYMLIDTAGMRKKGKINEATEKYSVIRALKSVERADVVLIMLNAIDKVTEQDQRIAGYVHEQGKANVIVVNKWDLIKKDGRTMNEFDEDIRDKLKFLAYSPILYISALTRKRIFKAIELVDFVAEQHTRRVNTSDLNKIINEAIMLNPLPGGGGKKIKIYYSTQVRTAPPSFVLFSNQPEKVHFSYLRYLENLLRQNYGFEGTPIRFYVRQRDSKE
ncbi:GTP-binding protein EngA [Candidatus Syntrophocurvum alkaliphilum]|uniref:GTPase Der n=1 Tax=Candidatus Syntrophocurvum alkaliphilum TaxID=2293317 RepID=A0A6I6DJ39_9FIRM|nr:ribosome biogenesis GTPase Der [Candidatus Syntrophocurvum alkaliphilum]QGT99834.1 GTP-binding protein EngA [Candidatus Syntrophocurvum alkaliphilum]